MHFCSTSILGMGFCQSWFPIFQFPKSNYFVKTFWPWIVDKIWILLLMCYMSLIGEILQLLKLLVFSFKLLCNIGNHIDLNPNMSVKLHFWPSENCSQIIPLQAFLWSFQLHLQHLQSSSADGVCCHGDTNQSNQTLSWPIYHYWSHRNP